MRLSLDVRARRLLRRLPRYTFYSIAELALLALLAVLAARLFWVIVTPVDPLGEWRLIDRTAAAVANRGQLFSSFDPFFRLAPSQPAVVTSLQLKLFGTRLNEASGRGSAIIAGPDGVQTSYGVGEEIMPGVVLKAVAFDSVTIDRGGTSEQLYIDQSTPAATPSLSAANAPPASIALDQPAAPGSQSFSREQIAQGIQAAPRNAGGRVTGLVLRPAGDGSVFAGAGFREGDILVSVDGQPVASASDVARLAQAAPGSNLSVQVERAGQTVPIVITIAR